VRLPRLAVVALGQVQSLVLRSVSIERGEGRHRWLLEGYSAIVAPTGEILAGPLVRERGILLADLELGSLPGRKRLFDATGHYNRPDVLRLSVDDRPKPAVVVEPLDDEL
jgi:hypothetical protein